MRRFLSLMAQKRLFTFFLFVIAVNFFSVFVWAGDFSGQPKKVKIVMLGDSLTQGGNWKILLSEYEVRNLGIGGDTTKMILARLQAVIEAKPDIIFLQAGINDLAGKSKPSEIIANHHKIWTHLKNSLPETKLYIISLFPVSSKKYPGLNNLVRGFNIKLESDVRSSGHFFIDLYPRLADNNGQLKPQLTYDGLHLTELAYKQWAGVIRGRLSADKE